MILESAYVPPLTSECSCLKPTKMSHRLKGHWKHCGSLGFASPSVSRDECRCQLQANCMQVNSSFVEEAKKALPDADAKIIVSCQVGRRGAMATKALQDAKFSHVENLEGGLQSWISAGLPTEK